MGYKDVFGQQMLKKYNNLPSFEVVERDDGFINVSNYNNLYLADYKDWEKHEKEAIKYVKGKSLDVGCGAGRVGLYLQKKGYYVLGIDTSPLAIKLSKLRGLRHVKILNIRDISKLKETGFVSIIMFGNNFGLFGNKKNARNLLKKMYNITTKGALIIAESRDPYVTNNPIHFKYHKNNLKKNRMPGQLRIKVRFMQYSTDWFDYLFVSKNEMKDILDGTGWRIKKFIDSDNFKMNGNYIAIIEKAL